MSGSVIRRSDFSDLVMEDALPALEEICVNEMEEFPLEYEDVLNVRSTTNPIVQFSQASGIPAAPEVAEGEEFQLDQPVQGYSKTIRVIKVGVMIGITYEMLDDNKWQEAHDRAEDLGRSVRETQKVHAARIFNNGFATNGPDGVPLFSASHPLPYPGAGTSSNLLGTPSDLSQTSLQDMVTLMRETKDLSGKKVLLRPEQLIVPAASEFLAHELTESTMKPQAGTANNISEVNMVNALRSRYGLQTVVMDYLTDDDAFFVACNKKKHKLYWYWRKQPTLRSFDEEKNEVGIMKISARFIADYANWYGIAGTPGA